MRKHHIFWAITYALLSLGLCLYSPICASESNLLQASDANPLELLKSQLGRLCLGLEKISSKLKGQCRCTDENGNKICDMQDCMLCTILKLKEKTEAILERLEISGIDLLGEDEVTKALQEEVKEIIEQARETAKKFAEEFSDHEDSEEARQNEYDNSIDEETSETFNKVIYIAENLLSKIQDKKKDLFEQEEYRNSETLCNDVTIIIDMLCRGSVIVEKLKIRQTALFIKKDCAIFKKKLLEQTCKHLLKIKCELDDLEKDFEKFENGSREIEVEGFSTKQEQENYTNKWVNKTLKYVNCEINTLSNELEILRESVNKVIRKNDEESLLKAEMAYANTCSCINSAKEITGRISEIKSTGEIIEESMLDEITSLLEASSLFMEELKEIERTAKKAKDLSKPKKKIPSGIYTVKEGETLKSVADEHSTSIHQIMQDNNLYSEDTYPGMLLRINSSKS